MNDEINMKNGEHVHGKNNGQTTTTTQSYNNKNNSYNNYYYDCDGYYAYYASPKFEEAGVVQLR